MVWVLSEVTNKYPNLFQARALFLKGVQHEQDGKLYEAVKFYRQAVQLVPDIETRLYEASKAKPQPIEGTGTLYWK